MKVQNFYTWKYTSICHLPHGSHCFQRERSQQGRSRWSFYKKNYSYSRILVWYITYQWLGAKLWQFQCVSYRVVAQVNQSHRYVCWWIDTTLIARFMGPTWGTPGADRCAPCRPYEPWYLGTLAVMGNRFMLSGSNVIHINCFGIDCSQQVKDFKSTHKGTFTTCTLTGICKLYLNFDSKKSWQIRLKDKGMKWVWNNGKREVPLCTHIHAHPYTTQTHKHHEDVNILCVTGPLCGEFIGHQ